MEILAVESLQVVDTIANQAEEPLYQSSSFVSLLSHADGPSGHCALPPPALPFALLAAWPLEADPSHRDVANDRDWSEPAAMTLDGPLFRACRCRSA